LSSSGKLTLRGKPFVLDDEFKIPFVSPCDDGLSAGTESNNFTVKMALNMYYGRTDA